MLIPGQFRPSEPRVLPDKFGPRAVFSAFADGAQHPAVQMPRGQYGQGAVAAVIDADSVPPTEHIGAGRLAVERLRGSAR